jgi:hypothetical protein
MLPWTGQGKIELHYSNPDVAYGSTEHSLRHEAEAQHEEDRRSGKTQSTSKDCGTAQIGDGQSGPPGETVTGTPTHRYSFADCFPHASGAKRLQNFWASAPTTPYVVDSTRAGIAKILGIERN